MQHAYVLLSLWLAPPVALATQRQLQLSKPKLSRAFRGSGTAACAAVARGSHAWGGQPSQTGQVNQNFVYDVDLTLPSEAGQYLVVTFPTPIDVTQVIGAEQVSAPHTTGRVELRLAGGGMGHSIQLQGHRTLPMGRSPQQANQAPPVALSCETEKDREKRAREAAVAARFHELPYYPPNTTASHSSGTVAGGAASPLGDAASATRVGADREDEQQDGSYEDVFYREEEVDLRHSLSYDEKEEDEPLPAAVHLVEGADVRTTIGRTDPHGSERLDAVTTDADLTAERSADAASPVAAGEAALPSYLDATQLPTVVGSARKVSWEDRLSWAALVGLALVLLAVAARSYRKRFAKQEAVHSALAAVDEEDEDEEGEEGEDEGGEGGEGGVYDVERARGARPKAGAKPAAKPRRGGAPAERPHGGGNGGNGGKSSNGATPTKKCDGAGRRGKVEGAGQGRRKEAPRTSTCAAGADKAAGGLRGSRGSRGNGYGALAADERNDTDSSADGSGDEYREKSDHDGGGERDDEGEAVSEVMSLHIVPGPAAPACVDEVVEPPFALAASSRHAMD